ncbi:MAG: hypothetical protein CM15mP46_2690 [Alphaproteobacteria bacterium]|nr:MAG: hypothetical protein CM15mP46_2690 [Alphaproteobacteria bacterium]
MIKTPEFWNHRGIMSVLLWPLSLIWAFASATRNHFATQSTAALPVICIGNITAGGPAKHLSLHFYMMACVPLVIARPFNTRLWGGGKRPFMG